MNLVKSIGLMILTAMMLSMMASPAPAQEKQTPAVTSSNPTVVPMGGAAMGAGLGAGLVIIGASFGFGKIGSAALESMARQPETAGRVQTAMIIIGALLEGVAFFALVVCFVVGQKA